MDIRHLPGIRWVDVVGAGRRGAHEIAQRAHHHVVARARPGLVADQLHVAVKRRVVEEVERFPAFAGGDLERAHGAVEVVGAVDMTGVAEVLVVLGLARERERVVAADRVADDLDERLHVEVVELPVQAGLRVGVAHQRPRDGRVESALDAGLQLAGVEGQEVRALLALDVDHLDVLAGADLVALGGRGVDPEVEAGLGERRRQLELLARARRARGGSRAAARSRAARRRRSVPRGRPPQAACRGRRRARPPRRGSTRGPNSVTVLEPESCVRPTASRPPDRTATWPPWRSMIRDPIVAREHDLGDAAGRDPDRSRAPGPGRAALRGAAPPSSSALRRR